MPINQNQSYSYKIFQFDSNGNPITGLSDLLMVFEQKAGETSLTNISSRTKREIGLGVYEIDLTSGDTNILGDLLIIGSGTGLNDYAVLNIVPEAVGPKIAIITENTSDVLGSGLGFVRTPGGLPLIGSVVNAFADADTSLNNPLFSTSVSDGDGGFNLQVINGAIYRIVFVHSGYTSEVKRVQV